MPLAFLLRAISLALAALIGLWLPAGETGVAGPEIVQLESGESMTLDEFIDQMAAERAASEDMEAAIKPSAPDLTGGLILDFYPEEPYTEALDERLDGAAEIVAARLEAAGCADAVAARGENGLIRVYVSEGEDPEAVRRLVTAPARLEFREPDGTVILTGEDVAAVSAAQDEIFDWQYNVAFELTDAGRDKFAEATRRLIGQTIGIWLDDELISAPTVQSAITEGRGVITMGNVSKEEGYREAARLAALIRFGALPLALRAAGE